MQTEPSRRSRSLAPVGGACLATALLVLCGAGPTQAQELRIGERVPDVALPTLTGDGKQLTRLSELTGERKVLLIEFASW